MDDIDLREIGAFVDGELGLSRHLEIERAAKDDARLAAAIAFARALRERVRSTGTYHAAPAGLRERLLGAGTVAERVAVRVPAAPPPTGTGTRTWWAWRPMVAGVAVAAVCFVGLQAWVANGRDEARLADDVLASHVRSTLGQHLVDVASSDHHTVKPWLSSKLDFSPPVRDAQIGTATFLGGRVDYVDGRPVAALVYRQGEHVVDDFLWPTAAADSHAVFSSERGYQIAHWTRDGINHWMISDVNRVEFTNLVNLIATPEAGR